MELEEAKELLSKSRRSELRDHAFGDCEVTWTTEGEETDKVVADGYFGSTGADVTIYIDGGKSFVTFRDDAARELRECSLGTAQVERNDETGPKKFVEGYIMPDLILEGVRQELKDEKTWIK